MAEETKRHRYDEVFKRQAVKSLLDSGKPVSTMALELGVDRCNLHKWKKKFGHEFEGESEKSIGEVVRSKEFRSLKNEVISIKETVNQLRNIIKRALLRKYQEDENLW